MGGVKEVSSYAGFGHHYAHEYKQRNAADNIESNLAVWLRTRDDKGVMPSLEIGEAQKADNYHSQANPDPHKYQDKHDNHTNNANHLRAHFFALLDIR